MGLYVIKLDRNGTEEYLGKQYEEAQYWGTLTGVDPSSYDAVWKDLSYYLGDNREAGITIFVSRVAARNYIKNITEYEGKFNAISIKDLDK